MALRIVQLVGPWAAIIGAAAGCSSGESELPADVRQAVARVEKSLQDLPQFRCSLAMSLRMKMRGIENSIQSDYDILVEKPRRWAIQLKSGAMGASSYCDGEQVTTYLPMSRNYVVHPLPKDWQDEATAPAAMADVLMLGPGGAAALLMGHGLADLLRDGVQSAQIKGVEQIDGVECQRIEIRQEEVEWQLWVEQGDRALPRRILVKPDLSAQMEQMSDEMGEMEMSVEIALNDWDLKPALTDAEFAFDPPAGSRQVDSLYEGLGGASIHALVGQPAPEFSLKRLDGDVFQLSDVLGQKVVMLDFWATWCGPCVQALPQVTAAAESFAGQDLIFFAVNVREDAEQIQSFLNKQDLKTPVLLDSKGEVSSLYQASGIPQTVLIGKDKRVQVVHVGAGPDVERLLKKQIAELLDGKDLAGEALAEDELQTEEASEPFGTTKAWSVPGAATSVQVDQASGTAYVLHLGEVKQFDAAGREQATFKLPTQNQTLRLADFGGEGPVLLTFSTWSSSLTACDRRGELLWEYPQGQGIDDVASVDIDGDGVDEVVVGYNGGSGLHVIDAAGKVIWKNTQLGNVWHVTAGRFLPRRDAPQVISTSATGQVHVFDASGERLDDFHPPLYGNGVQFVPAFDSGGPMVLVAGSTDAGEAIAALSPEGDVLWQTDLPGAGHVDGLAASADGSHAAAAMRGGLVYVLELTAGEVVAQVRGAGPVVDANLLANGRRLLLIVADGRAVTAYVVGEPATIAADTSVQIHAGVAAD